MTRHYHRAPARRQALHHFVTHDPNEAMEHFAAFGASIAISQPNRPSGRIEISTLNHASDGIVFTRTSFEDPVEIQPRQSPCGYELLLALKGATNIELEDRVIRCERLQAAIFDVGETKALHRSAHSENYSVLLDRNLLTNRLFELTGAPVMHKLRFEAELDLEQPSVGALRCFLMGLDLSMLVELLQDSRHGARRLSALLADLILEVLPHNHTKALERSSHVIAPKHVKRTIEFIRENARRPITPEELAAVAGVSLRALQYGFQKFLRVSISEYERSVRLEGVRREIEGNSGESVGEIARRWRFSNFTRFNAQFEAAFGVNAVALRAQLGQFP
ncbi:helix-turn-helix domain-containing protein [Bosea sp. TAF32]|uniref:helix-turn-helix transcriptional regulator n=1 Tax=Bosea sp. TAF32 TaxID=3237482 RepID=UPI003F914166